MNGLQHDKCMLHHKYSVKCAVICNCTHCCCAAARNLHTLRTSRTSVLFVPVLESVPLAHRAPVLMRLRVRIYLLRPKLCPAGQMTASTIS